MVPGTQLFVYDLSDGGLVLTAARRHSTSFFRDEAAACLPQVEQTDRNGAGAIEERNIFSS
jgi:hypothetical protein